MADHDRLVLSHDNTAQTWDAMQPMLRCRPDHSGDPRL